MSVIMQHKTEYSMVSSLKKLPKTSLIAKTWMKLCNKFIHIVTSSLRCHDSGPLQNLKENFVKINIIKCMMVSSEVGTNGHRFFLRRSLLILFLGLKTSHENLGSCQPATKTTPAKATNGQ